MKKIAIIRSNGSVSSTQMEDPTEWIADGVAGNWWGLPERPELDAEGQPTGVILPAEYTISIEDITTEHELQQAIMKRKAAYPSPEEFMNAFFDGGDEAIEELRQKRLQIKQLYPKP